MSVSKCLFNFGKFVVAPLIDEVVVNTVCVKTVQ